MGRRPLPWKGRELSATGIHHIWIRGINRQRLFEEDADYEQFLSILKETKELFSWYYPLNEDK
jgi:hypothetical protein